MYRWLGWCLAWLLGALPVLAHHSFAAEYDDTKPVKFSGVVTKVEWMNPHIWFYVDEKKEDGTITHWAISGGAPGQLMRRGINKDVIQPGMMIVVEGFRAKDGTDNANGTKVSVPRRPSGVHQQSGTGFQEKLTRSSTRKEDPQ